MDSNYHRDSHRWGWQFACQKYFYQGCVSKRREKRDQSKPSSPQSPTIIIPIHVHGSHWVILCRRIINKQIFFLYADDMNLSNTEESIKSQYSNTDFNFHPPNSIWINCLSFTYPGSLLAASIMSIHPNPNCHILLPYMHSNLAQLSCWWVAKTILFDSFDANPSSLNMESFPYDLDTEQNQVWKQHQTELDTDMSPIEFFHPRITDDHCLSQYDDTETLDSDLPTSQHVQFFSAAHISTADADVPEAIHQKNHSSSQYGWSIASLYPIYHHTMPEHQMTQPSIIHIRQLLLIFNLIALPYL
jgi:hypothetical protein